MVPAFSSTRHAVSFGAVLIALLTLPVVLHSLGRVSLEQSYRGISERAGAYAYNRRQIFDEHEPVDIVFCGSSLVRNAIDSAIVQRELSRAIGREARVIVLPQSWQGLDLNYYVARDLIERRKVRILVLGAPALVHRSSQPHVQLFRVVRYGDHSGALEGLGLRSRMATYSEFVLGAPRQALNLLRDNPLDTNASLQMDISSRQGYMGGPFVERPTEPPPLDSKAFFTFDRSTRRFASTRAISTITSFITCKRRRSWHPSTIRCWWPCIRRLPLSAVWISCRGSAGRPRSSGRMWRLQASRQPICSGMFPPIDSSTTSRTNI